MTTSDFGADVFDDGDPLDDQPASTPARARRTRKPKSPDQAESADPAAAADDPATPVDTAPPVDTASAGSDQPDGDAETGGGEDDESKPARKSTTRKKKAASRRKATRKAAESAADPADDSEHSPDEGRSRDDRAHDDPARDLAQRDDQPDGWPRSEQDPADDDSSEDAAAEPRRDDRAEDRPSRERRRRRRGPRSRFAESAADDDQDAAATGFEATRDPDDDRHDEGGEAEDRDDVGLDEAGADSEFDEAGERPEAARDADDRRRSGRDGDRDDDGEFGARRGKRRRRRRHGGDGDYEDEGDDGPTPSTRPSRDHARRIAFRAPAPDAGRQGQRVAVFVDLDGLLSEAPGAGGTNGSGAAADPALAYGRLLAALTGRRHLIRAFAYGDGSAAATLDGNGFEHRAVADRLARVVAVTVDALQVAPRVDTVVFVGADDALAPLYQALAAQGIRIETAGFGPASSEAHSAAVPASHHHALGEECTFRP